MGALVAYMMSRFPHLPETFILREMNELEQQGWTIALYPLIVQQQKVVHPDAQPWIDRARHFPFVSLAILGANGSTAAQQPGQYGRLWATVTWNNRQSANLLIRAVALLPKAVAIARSLQQAGIRHIHAHYATHPALVAWIVHRLTGISYSITVHAHDIFVRQAMLATKLREATFIAAISDFNREYLARTVGEWVRAKTHIVHCGIAPAQYRLAPVRHPAERLEIISTGSLQPYKGHRYLIDACAQLRQRGIAFRCRIIGDGEDRATLHALICRHDLTAQVELVGPQPQQEVARLLATAHCYVQPSIITPSGKMEGIPVALMEALACRLPTVATALSGIPELIQPDRTGYLVPPANSTALADAIDLIYQHPEEAYQRAEAGRRLVLDDFSLQPNVTRLAGLLSGALAGHHD